ncbi:MAG: LamG domain-containing protein [Kiritimatiellaeota bacterium]|nr:LamG domain-containing protein [Kiritimatiellota bacterium]
MHRAGKPGTKWPEAVVWGFWGLLAAVGLSPVGAASPGVLQLDFEAAGPASARIRLVDCRPGEGPYFSPGPWGDCLDLRQASRAGGLAPEGVEEAAGGVGIVPGERVPDSGDFTVACWFRRAPLSPDVNARILNRVGSWEVTDSRARLGFYVTGDKGKKVALRFGTSGAWSEGDWRFFAVTVSRRTGKVVLFRASLRGSHSIIADATLPDGLRPGRGDLEIGNLAGIRPFRGLIDNVRIVPGALPAGRIEAMIVADRKRAFRSGSVLRGLPEANRPLARFRIPATAIFLRALSQSRLEKLDGYKALSTYHATHLLWVYGAETAPVRRVRDMGIFYEAALNGMTGAEVAGADPDAASDRSGRQWNFDGRKFMLPHMRAWKVKHPLWVGCENSPDFRSLFFARATGLVRLGVDAIHVDDWEMSAGMARRGLGCFCPHCMQGFRAFLATRLGTRKRREFGIPSLATFDYRKYLETHDDIHDAAMYRQRFRSLALTPLFLAFHRASVRQFYRELRRRLDAVSPQKYIAVSVNNQFRRKGAEGRFGGWYAVDVVDFFAGEAWRGMQRPVDYIMPCKVAAAFGIPQVMMSKPGPVAASQAALATSYALGQWFRVPWDVYMDNGPDGQPAPRYFGAESDWKPFYDFISEHPGLFRGYRIAADTAILFRADSAPYGPVFEACRQLAARQVQFRCIVAADAAGALRRELNEGRFRGIRRVLLATPESSFSTSDAAVIDRVRTARRTRFYTSLTALLQVLDAGETATLRVEGPPGIFAFVRGRRAAGGRSFTWSTGTIGGTGHGARSSDISAFRSGGRGSGSRTVNSAIPSLGRRRWSSIRRNMGPACAWWFRNCGLGVY